MMEIAVEGGAKVLLSRVGDAFYATNASCSHYAAPLAKGVLVGGIPRTPRGGHLPDPRES